MSFGLRCQWSVYVFVQLGTLNDLPWSRKLRALVLVFFFKAGLLNFSVGLIVGLSNWITELGGTEYLEIATWLNLLRLKLRISFETTFHLSSSPCIEFLIQIPETTKEIATIASQTILKRDPCWLSLRYLTPWMLTTEPKLLSSSPMSFIRDI